MSKFFFTVWGGTIRSGTSGSDPVIEEWSNSLGWLVPDTADPAVDIDSVYPLVYDWFTAGATKISSTVRLEYVKLNEYDLTTGHQITDPTVEHIFSSPPPGGSSSPLYPLGTSYRVSLDNGTRNRKARGGFYVPRTTIAIGPEGRFDPSQLTAAAGTASTLLDGFEDSTHHPGVWSRADRAFYPSTRIRVGDVPDNISRRRNELREAYTVIPIT